MVLVIISVVVELTLFFAVPMCRLANLEIINNKGLSINNISSKRMVVNNKIII